MKTKSSLNPAPAKKASKKAPKEAAKKELPVAESRPKGWKCVSEKASVEYSTTTKFDKFPDTLLTTQASPFAFHTDSEKAPWLIVDLKKSVPVSGLLIQNREDSLFKRVNNLHVWVSDDKASWKQVFETKGAKKEWLVKLDAPTTARYVKVGMLNGDKPEFFHLKGLRIFGP